MELHERIWTDPYQPSEKPKIGPAKCIGGPSSVCTVCGRLRVRKDGDLQHSSCDIGMYGEMGGFNWTDKPGWFIRVREYSRARKGVKA